MATTVNLSGFKVLVPAELVKTAMESYTGVGSIEALVVRQKDPNHNPYVMIQFTNRSKIEDILKLSMNDKLWYGPFKLKVWELKYDIVQKPSQFAFEINDATLYFGCQVSKESLSVLCKMKSASVKYDFELKKIHFVVPWSHDTSYKLELCNENVWQVQLHHPPGVATRFLVFKLYGAPRIYQILENELYAYYKDLLYNKWVRATDFTPSFALGQSTHICIKLQGDFKTRDLGHYFPDFTQTDHPFKLVTGRSFSRRSDLVPIVGHSAYNLPFNIVFKISALVQSSSIPGPNLGDDCFRLLDPQMKDIESIEQAMNKIYFSKECCYDPVRFISEEYRKDTMSTCAISLDSGLVYVRRVQITPSKVYFCGPDAIVSNRVLRQFSDYIDNFLRVSFLDEELVRLSSKDLYPKVCRTDQRTGLYMRILLILTKGIVIGDKKFQFLAFSSSQLRENSLWMFADTGTLTAADIRNWIGDFSSIKNVAKYAARLGQSFGSSKESLHVASDDVEEICDIETIRSGTKYVFSDGIGKMSVELAKKVSNKCGYDPIPSAFQIRYGGYKGVVAVDPTSSMSLSLRKSMCKFKSNNTSLDILAVSKYQPSYMNRQIITLLSTLGVSDHIFEKKQQTTLFLLDAILLDPMKAAETLDLMSPAENTGTEIMKGMLLCGYEPNVEPFLSMMLQAFRATKLLELRTKTRIFIPEGRLMMGCLDETRTLEYGQVFVQHSSAGLRPMGNVYSGTGSYKPQIVTADVVVAKNPCLHPGDVRVFKAVNVPALHHMVDCIVFPQKGERPHPNECSGSDLDGDLYFVCWDPDLIPPQQVEPMDYTPAPSDQLDHDVTLEEVQKYFADYILNDNVGIIANAHLVTADREPTKAKAEPCVELAKLFSTAVDSPKTGVPAELPSCLWPKEYPDFMEKLDKTTYESQNVIGKLFRKVKHITPQNSPDDPLTEHAARLPYDADMEVQGFEKYIDEAFAFKNNYDKKLSNLMDYYGIKTEAELLMCTPTNMPRSKYDAEAVSLAVKSLTNEARNWFRYGGDRNTEDDDVCAKASAWYHVTNHQDYWGHYDTSQHFMSFPWCIHDKLIQIKKQSDNQKGLC